MRPLRRFCNTVFVSKSRIGGAIDDVLAIIIVGRLARVNGALRPDLRDPGQCAAVEHGVATHSQRSPRRFCRWPQAYAATAPTINPMIRLGMLLASSMVACLSA